MIERRICSHFRRRCGEAAFMLGESVRFEGVLTRQVLRMHKSLGAGDPGPKLGRRFARLALAIIRMAARGKICLRQLGPLRPLAPCNARAEPNAIAALRRAKYSRWTPKTSERIVLCALLQRGDCADRRSKERD